MDEVVLNGLFKTAVLLKDKVYLGHLVLLGY
jgi:hypothetical protein